MGRFFDLVTDPVRSLGEFAPDKPRAFADRGIPLLKLNSNESPYGPSPKALAAMSAVLKGSHLYPDDHATDLRRKLAEIHAIDSDSIFIANGTTALLGVIARTLLRPGQNAITCACSFISYPMVTNATGAVLIETPLRNGGYNLEAILAAINQDTRVVFIANPNNPTGTLLEAAAIDVFVKRIPPHVVVVLDEAYYDYAQYFAAARGVEYSHSLDYAREDRNVVVLRTFSKAHGLAGVRVGYGIGPAELMAYFARTQDVFAVSSAAQAAALAASEDVEHVRHAVEENTKQAELLVQRFSRLGYSLQPTWTNFFFVDVQQDAREVARRMRAEGVLIRPLTAWGAPSSIRVTIGTHEQNQKFLQAFQKVMGCNL
jgi:histidinol-phosphate aminotransferase